MVFSKTLYSSANDGWCTPLDFFKSIDNEFHFVLDACTTDDNPLGTPKFYTKETNGLINDWYNPTFVNPPYRKGVGVREWLQKAIIEQNCRVTSVMLLPARTDTLWFHDYVHDKKNVEIRFIKGRLKFNIPKDGELKYAGSSVAPFPSMLVIFRGMD